MDENPIQTTQENQVVTEATEQTNQVIDDNAPVVDNLEPEKRYSRDEVTEMMKKRVERSHNAFFKRYNVENLQALDELFERSKKYSEMNDEFGKIQLRNSELARENAFLKNNVNPEKYDDIIAYFKGKDIEFSEEELLKAIALRPEWLKPSNIPAQTTIKSLGAEQKSPKPETEDEKFIK